MDLLTNPWVISLLAMGFMVSNIMALKYVSKLKLGQYKKNKSTEEKSEHEHSDKEENSTGLNTDTDTDKK
ncbi:DUF2897 family protein [Vibrio genomosp. F10]|uniref:DUF2897 family protein n=1 Tax=Vibrio genomosp. F10 TaxID=723171 RepID=UPI00030F4628|nr:DUF2897 family protein [Vibrio genomosp. F10]OEE82420.1 hypothetical protein A1QK_20595 [Vibrio genomosp. F10 str. 9ZD137]